MAVSHAHWNGTIHLAPRARVTSLAFHTRSPDCYSPAIRSTGRYMRGEASAFRLADKRVFCSNERYKNPC